MKRLPRMAGDRWRILVHEKPESLRGHWMYGKAHDIRGMTYSREFESAYEVRHPVPESEFDELVVGQWIHLEQMSTGFWWMNIGGVTVHVTADRYGRPRRVTVHGPDMWAASEPGVEYHCDWPEEPS